MFFLREIKVREEGQNQTREAARKSASALNANVTQVGGTFGVSRQTVYNILEEEAGENKRKKRGGPVYQKISPQMSIQMANMIIEDPAISAKSIKEQIQAEDDVNLSVSHINRHLRDGITRHVICKFTIKKLRVHEDARDSDETKQDRIRYIDAYYKLKLTGSEFIFIDESSFEELELRNKGRSTIGTPAIQHRAKRQVIHVSAITAVCATYGVLHVTFVQGSCNSETYVLFLDSLQEEIDRKQLNACVLVMDNSPIHHTAEVQKKLTKFKNLILFTAKWSCELNPIEYIFGIWKHRIYIPPKETNQRIIIQLLNETFAKIDAEEVRRCITMVELLLFPLAKNKESIKLNTGVQHIQHDQSAKYPVPPKKPSVPQTQEQMINNQLKERDMQLIFNSAGGDCFFKSVSQSIYKNDKFHLQIRKDAALYMEQHKNQFEHFFVDGFGDELMEVEEVEWKNVEKLETLDEYIKRMKKPGEWATQPIILATALNEKKSIEIITATHEPQIINGTVRQSVILGYTNNNHYQAAINRYNIQQ
ncbi:MAG: hypothetical protein EZS28_029221 [Streblomastix strix]|uniref:OTU domain-containing protein n=1 Tax=Streblomastix strix TaxID=222440 RepID=A0A5J4UYQ0_9EUKA|nr:MAG: hypothetical protein EZS28_029221 [Streblomastix strix]